MVIAHLWGIRSSSNTISCTQPLVPKIPSKNRCCPRSDSALLDLTQWMSHHYLTWKKEVHAFMYVQNLDCCSGEQKPVVSHSCSFGEVAGQKNEC